MNTIFYGLLISSVICGSAIVTYFISISRERLWLRSQKAEDLYRRAEKTDVDGLAFFRARYDMTQGKIFPRANNDLSALNEDVAELNILVGLYFPSLALHLATATNSLAVAFDMLRLAEAADGNNRERALDNLDLAVGAIREAFDQLKGAALNRGQIEKSRGPAYAGNGAVRRGSRAAVA
jgi:hypothetical protein